VIRRVDLQSFSSTDMLRPMMMTLILSVFVMPPAAAITALLGYAVRRGRSAPNASLLAVLLVGTAVPLAMLVYGLYLSWPWPWARPEALHDGLGQPGAILVATSGPASLVCLLVSRRILRREKTR
jgi:ABC-type glycerol-3-phosphate transport system permease component